MTPKQAFASFLESLELTRKQRDEASRQHTFLRTELQRRLSTTENFLSGSYARRTAIRPLNDIDVFVVLDRRKHAGPEQGQPSGCLSELQSALNDIYPNKSWPVLQSRSVHLRFSGTGLAYDVVPAFSSLEDEGVYFIPDRGTDTWIATNPKRHAALSTAANEAAGKMLKPLTKAVKHWNYRGKAPLRSFHLEVMTWSVLTSKPAGWLDGLTQLLEGLAERVLEPCPDPARLGPSLERGLDRGAARVRLLDAARLARTARDFDAQRQPELAHHALRELFGPEYPERGRTPTTSR